MMAKRTRSATTKVGQMPSVTISPVIKQPQIGILLRLLRPATEIKDHGIGLRSEYGHFGWSIIENQFIPHIFRQTETYLSVRIVDALLIKKYERQLHPLVFSCVSIPSYAIMDCEVKLLNEINTEHCDLAFGLSFTQKEILVRESDIEELIAFLNFAIKRLQEPKNNEKCGFLNLNKEALVPFVTIEGEKCLPLFYFEVDANELKPSALTIENWDFIYLKFCFKVQQIKETLYNSQTLDVIKLSELQKHYPNDTSFEECWPQNYAKHLLLRKSGRQ